MGWIDEKRLPNGLLRPLTKRQEEVVALLALGLEYSDIAEQLDPPVSVDRVKQLVNAIAALLPNRRRLTPYKLVLIWAIAQHFNAQGRERD